jgi:ABC-type glycerol-3-phosphate transport system substrate-binding protein
MESAYTLPFKTELGTGGYQWTCSGVSISQLSEHKEEAYLFLKHLMSDEVADRMLEHNKLAWATDYAFAQLATSDDQVLNKLPLMAANDPDNNYSGVPLPNNAQLNDFFKAIVQEVMNGTLSIDEAVIKLDEEYQRNIDAGF